jgi:hypothetical protein
METGRGTERQIKRQRRQRWMKTKRWRQEKRERERTGRPGRDRDIERNIEMKDRW